MTPSDSIRRTGEFDVADRQNLLGGRPSLEEIGTRYGTDKSSSCHGYLNFYDSVLKHLRDRSVTLLEIGVFNGASTKMWRDYFSNGQIVGLDIDERCRHIAEGRITIEIGDQSDVADLSSISAKYGPFDIVIDDGSHIWDHQITALQYLYPFVKTGGFYILEDLHTSFGKHAQAYKGRSESSGFDYLQKLSRYIVAYTDLDRNEEEDSFIRSFAARTEWITFHRRTAVLRCSAPWRPYRSASPPPLSVEQFVGSVGGLRLLIHCATIGDVINPSYSAHSRDSETSVVQAFEFTA